MPLRPRHRLGRVITWVRAADSLATLQFISSSGAEVRKPIPIGPVSVPTALAWSLDGAHAAMVNLPGFAAEAWALRLAGEKLWKLAEFPPSVALDGVTWTRDGSALLIGRTEYEAEVLLLDGFSRAR